MFYPIFLDLSGKRCLVVGGGRVALRKVIALLRANALVTVVTTSCCERLRRLNGRLVLHERPFTPEDLTGDYILVIGATDQPEVNAAVSRRAEQLAIPCNIVDQPALCSFIVPAQLRRGDVTVAIATGGVSPRLSRYLKTVIAGVITPLHGELAAYLGTIRLRLRTLFSRIEERSSFWEALFSEDPVEILRREGWGTFERRTEKLIETHLRQRDMHEQT